MLDTDSLSEISGVLLLLQVSRCSEVNQPRIAPSPYCSAFCGPAYIWIVSVYHLSDTYLEIGVGLEVLAFGRQIHSGEVIHEIVGYWILDSATNLL